MAGMIVAERIAREGFVISDRPEDQAWMRDASMVVNAALERGMMIDGAYAAEFLAQQAKAEPNSLYVEHVRGGHLFPPHSLTLIEYPDSHGVPMAVICSAIDRQNCTDDVRAMLDANGRAGIYACPSERWEEVRFYLSFWFILAMPGHRIVAPSFCTSLCLDKDGQLISDNPIISARPSFHEPCKDEKLHTYLTMNTTPALEVFYLLNCKNVVTKDNPMDAKAAKKLAKQSAADPSRYVYKTLVVKVPGRKGRPATEIELKTGCDRQKAEHVVRAHVHRYSAERPMFGRLVGTFVIPHHMRGTRERGVIEKRYRLKPDN